jgi:hypothetical protein
MTRTHVKNEQHYGNTMHFASLSFVQQWKFLSPSRNPVCGQSDEAPHGRPVKRQGTDISLCNCRMQLRSARICNKPSSNKWRTVSTFRPSATRNSAVCNTAVRIEIYNFVLRAQAQSKSWIYSKGQKEKSFQKPCAHRATSFVKESAERMNDSENFRDFFFLNTFLHYPPFLVIRPATGPV